MLRWDSYMEQLFDTLAPARLAHAVMKTRPDLRLTHAQPIALMQSEILVLRFLP